MNNINQEKIWIGAAISLLLIAIIVCIVLCVTTIKEKFTSDEKKKEERDYESCKQFILASKNPSYLNDIKQNIVYGPNLVYPWMKPFGIKKLKNGKVIGSNSAGSAFVCDSEKNCPELKRKFDSKAVPHYPESANVGYASSMTIPEWGIGSCNETNNFINAYADPIYNKQNYRFCTNGSRNQFNSK